MNYKNVYKQLMDKASSAQRTKGKGTMYEAHHIVPDFMFLNRTRSGPRGHLPGNPNDKQNIVLLTTREHLIAHVLLCKILRGERYEYSAYCSLNLLLSGGKSVRGRKDLKEVYGNTSFYAKVRDDARSIISKHRKGTMPVKDVITGKIVGSVRVDHPKCLTGEWIHHSKGVKLSAERVAQVKELAAAENNPRFSGISNETLLNEYRILTKRLGKIPTFQFFRKVYFCKYGVEFPKSLSKFRFNHGKDLISILEKEFNMVHDKSAKWSHKLNPQDYV